MKLICFAVHANAIERMLGPHMASVGELVQVGDGAGLKDAAARGDALVIASSENEQPAPQVFEIARAAGLQVWSLHDQWAKAEPDAAIEPEPQAPEHAAAAQGMATPSEEPTALKPGDDPIAV